MPTFTLQPDLLLLEKHGYLFDPSIEIESVWTDEQRLFIEEGFRILANEYGLSDHYDTLLYIILVRHDDADLQFQQKHKVYHEHTRVKELAQVLSIFEPSRKHQPSSLRISTSLDTIKLTDPTLIEWIGSLINDAIEKGNYIPNKLGEAVIDLARNERGEILGNNRKLDYRKIATYASQTIRKPTVRERNRALAPFLLYVYDFLQRETNLSAPNGTRFSDSQLKFLFEVAELLGWISEDGIDAETKDYMYTLLLNFIKLNH